MMLTRAAVLAAATLLFGCTAEASTFRNCDSEWTVDASPRRILALNQHAADLVLALVGPERLIGVAWLDDAPEAAAAKIYRGVPVISPEYPSREVLEALAPDLVVGGFTSAFLPGQGPETRERLREAGIASYLTEDACVRDDPPSPFETVRRDIRTLAEILGVPAQGRAVLAHFDSELAKVSAARPFSRLRVMIYDNDTRAPYIEGRRSFLSAAIEAAGGDNVFADVDRQRITVSWEEVLARDPEVIVLTDAMWSTAASKRAFLAEDPILRDITAVRRQRFVVVPFSQSTPTVAAADMAARLANQLRTFAEAR